MVWHLVLFRLRCSITDEIGKRYDVSQISKSDLSTSNSVFYIAVVYHPPEHHHIMLITLSTFWQTRAMIF